MTDQNMTFQTWNERQYAACFGVAGAAVHATPNQLLTANAVPVTINGRIVTVAADAAIPFVDTTPVQPANTKRYYVLASDVAGALKIVFDETNYPYFPSIPKTHAPVAYILVETNASTIFVPGTTNFDAAGVTTTVVDIHALPPEPDTSKLA